jgi:hypothetical protein
VLFVCPVIVRASDCLPPMDAVLGAKREFRWVKFPAAPEGDARHKGEKQPAYAKIRAEGGAGLCYPVLDSPDKS